MTITIPAWLLTVAGVSAGIVVLFCAAIGVYVMAFYLGGTWWR